MLLRETNHIYRDWKGAEGYCWVRIYAGTEASANLPIVILTEPNDNHGPSVTNTIEQIAAEVLTRYLPGLDGFEPPWVFVEHYPYRQPRGAAARYHDPFFGETFDVVTFNRWSPRLCYAGGQRALHTLGTLDRRTSIEPTCKNWSVRNSCGLPTRLMGT